MEKQTDFSLMQSSSVKSIRENIEAIIIAFIMAMVIRCFCIEVYQIPTQSMEPTLMGHEEERDSEGNIKRMSIKDRIMVTKFFYEFSPIERFDVIVFKNPLNQAKNFIKRLVGLPDEEIFIENGNIYFRKLSKSNSQFQIAKKPLRIQQAIWLEVQEGINFLKDQDAFGKYWDTEGSWFIQNSKLYTNECKGSKDSKFTYKKNITDGDDSGDIDDIKLSLDFEVFTTSGYFFTEIRNKYGRFVIQLSPSYSNNFTYIDANEKSKKIPLRTENIKPNRLYKLEFFVYDGTAFVILDGKIEASLDFLTYYSKDLRLLKQQDLYFSAYDLLFSVQDIKIYRDIFYKAKENMEEGIPVKIPPRSYIVMGDNVNRSHDSRGWEKHVFILKNGTEIICEGIEIATDEEKRKNPEWRNYDYVIKSDIHGAEHRFNEQHLKDRLSPESFMFVDEKYIMGKGFWIWWPPQRAFRLIR